MKKTLQIAVTIAFAASLAACGSATDASEDAIADNVEVPADEAMTGAPAPVADAEALTEATDAAETDAVDAADAAEAMVAEDAPATADAMEAAAE